MRNVFMHIIPAITVLISPIPTCATYFAGGISNGFVVVAIDSRATNGMNPRALPNDHYCKILPIGDNLVFFATGVVAANNGTVFFDVRDVARDSSNIFRATQLRKIMEYWADHTEAVYNRYLSATGLPINAPIVEGFFAGAGASGNIEVYKATITRSIGTFTHTIEKLAAGDDKVPIFNNGHPEILDEITTGTDRAKRLQARITERTFEKPLPEVLAIATSELVEFVRDASFDPGIGGEVATIIMERGEKWRWFYRPAFCPEK